MSGNKPCAGCAFVKDTAANSEPYNALTAQICLLGGVPFYCHHDEDCTKPDAHKPKGRSAMRICAGWRRETAQLSRSGYFKIHKAEKRVYAQIALAALDTFTGKETSQVDQKTAHRTLRDCLKWLFQARDKCLSARKYSSSLPSMAAPPLEAAPICETCRSYGD